MSQFLKETRRRSRLLVALALAALVPATLAAIAPIVYQTPALTSVAISLDPGDQFDPHVSGDWVAYTSELRIHYYNFSTNVDAEIPIGTGSAISSPASAAAESCSRVSLWLYRVQGSWRS